MSVYDAERIEKPTFFRIAATKRGRGKRTPYVVGFDSEADDSRPFLFQFSEPGMTEEDTFLLHVPDEEHAGFRVLLEYVVQRILPRHFARTHEVIIYGFNLEYEWTQLFHDMDAEVKASKDVTIAFEYADRMFKVHAYMDKRNFATIEEVGSKVLIRVLDGYAFYKTSLNGAAKMLGLIEKVEYDRETISRDLLHDEEFLRYAKRDAYITRLLGEHIVGLHQEFDIRQTITAPHFASSVFKRKFLTTEVRPPDGPLEQAGLWSYHGGKNGFYLPGPAEVPGCYQYDITSAYPEAMRQLPNIETAEWVKVDRYEPGQHAIFHVTVEYRRCPYRGMMTHDGDWPESGYIEDVCLTSYELDAMWRRGEIRVITCHGWVMTGPPGGPLVDFVDTFFAQKARSTGAERETAKLLLNSLYGKFFQKVALGDVGYYDLDTGEMIEHNPDGEYDYRAGGLYHPPIASLITGFVRAKLHGMEHKYRAIMSSTDGIFAYEPPDPADIGKHLGGLTVEHGDLRIWRERVYVFRSPDLPKPKVAYHGFMGSLDQLESIPLAHGTYAYTSRHMVTLKESLRRFGGRYYPPGSFIEETRQIVL